MMIITRALTGVYYWWNAWRGSGFIWPLCPWCRIRPLWADDVGFFYLHPYKGEDQRNDQPCCEHCYRGQPGKMHTDLYGVGER
jgi:hypothetical protein